ncbi:LOW QUALITY PROTEIN: hypothetical protein PanWU01x14_314980 [Parasponia andersonii]|uniref:Transmembrane protein n=1 Tax=Parasponia andersonii TaxID=3476 RepID=A0A2P5ANJ4_PARAD|nr:LOW QUALITY PROTEIN: hypothetical protein PanWU01x14_314980 [Parasponia andersonii]
MTRIAWPTTMASVAFQTTRAKRWVSQRWVPGHTRSRSRIFWRSKRGWFRLLWLFGLLLFRLFLRFFWLFRLFFRFLRLFRLLRLLGFFFRLFRLFGLFFRLFRLFGFFLRLFWFFGFFLRLLWLFGFCWDLDLNALNRVSPFAYNLFLNLLRRTANHFDCHCVLLLIVYLVLYFSCSQNQDSIHTTPNNSV